MTRVVCISAGQISTKKIDNRINRCNLYLNYGLLSLASVVARSGFRPVVIHGHFSVPSDTLKTALAYGLAESRLPVLLSVPSFYAIDWAQEFIAEAKMLFPFVRFIVGGRWVIGNRPDLLKKLLPEADQIISGLAEDRIVELLTGMKDQSPRNLCKTSNLDYRLLHERAIYQPSIEIARGCGMGCSFCQEKDEALQTLKSPSILLEELKSTLLADGLVEMTPYFETSMFIPNKRWVDGLKATFDQAGMAVKWRTEGRVDTIKPELMPALKASGLRILDLGLESASPIQLLRMKKTRDPERYLERASRLLQACAENKVKVKINILLFAGENEDTIAQTLHWLEDHREFIYGVSAGPVIVFGWPDGADTYLQSLAEFGATKAHSPCSGITHVNLSESVNFTDSVALSRLISRRFMRAGRYYKLKSFSYFPRTYEFKDFLLDVAQEAGSHSFSTAFLEECLDEVMGTTAQAD